jgi:hypothetical protein
VCVTCDLATAPTRAHSGGAPYKEIKTSISYLALQLNIRQEVKSVTAEWPAFHRIDLLLISS